MLPSALGSREEVASAQGDHLEIRPLRVGDGLGHSGEPEEAEEVIVLEEPKSEEAGPKVVRVPRTPTQAEIDAHEAKRRWLPRRTKRRWGTARRWGLTRQITP